ncbi:hypothetical protein K501DRAFT_331924 [Backusella circina FSU 941]|nr:hypothetical protein K501DRAFT_331924 [Backusella circina FSU 941]
MNLIIFESGVNMVLTYSLSTISWLIGRLEISALALARALFLYHHGLDKSLFWSWKPWQLKEWPKLIKRCQNWVVPCCQDYISLILHTISLWLEIFCDILVFIVPFVPLVNSSIKSGYLIEAPKPNWSNNVIKDIDALFPNGFVFLWFFFGPDENVRKIWNELNRESTTIYFVLIVCLLYLLVWLIYRYKRSRYSTSILSNNENQRIIRIIPSGTEFNSDYLFRSTMQ